MGESTGVLPHHVHNIATARAVLLELHGDTEAARRAYLEAARGWETFGSVHETSFARAAAERCSGGR